MPKNDRKGHAIVMPSSVLRPKKKFLTCILLFVFVALSQKIVSVVAPHDGNFQKHITAAKLFSQSKLDAERVTDFSPLYFDLNLTLFRWFGSYEEWLMLLQVAAAGFSVVAFYLITARYFSHWTAVIGALGLSLSSSFVVLAQIFVPDIWFLTFLLSGIWLLVKNHNGSNVSLFLPAAFFGLALFTRPTALLYIPFALVAVYFTHQKSFVKTGSFLLVFLIFLALLLLRNHQYAGKTTLLAMDPGGVFFEGNNPYSDGNGVNTPLIKDLEGQYRDQPSYAQVLLKRIPSAVSGHKMNTDESNRYWQSKALHYIKDHPAAYSRLMLRKIHRLLQTSEVHDVLPALVVSTKLREKHFPMIPTSVIAIFALLGIYLKRTEWKDLWLLYGGFLIGCAVPLIYFVSIRYRLPLIPFLLFFSCASAEYAIAELRRRKLRSIFLVAAAGGLLAAGLDLQMERGNTPDDVWISVKKAHRLQASAADLRNAGKRNLASESISSAIAAAPFLHEGLILANLPYPAGDPLERAITIKRKACPSASDRSCYFDLALLLLHADKIPEAKKIFELLAQSGGTFRRWYICSGYPEYYLGRIAGCHDHNWNEAVRLYQNVLRRNPGEAQTLAGITVALEKTGRQKQADFYRRQLFRYFDEVDAMFFLGESYWHAGDFQKSKNCFTQVVQWLPDYRKAHIYAAAALGKIGRIEDAVLEYWRAAAIKEEPLLLPEAILTIFQENAARQKTSQSYFVYGVVLRQFGRFQEAQQMQILALQLQPEFPLAKAELKSLATVLSAN